MTSSRGGQRNTPGYRHSLHAALADLDATRERLAAMCGEWEKLPPGSLDSRICAATIRAAFLADALRLCAECQGNVRAVLCSDCYGASS